MIKELSIILLQFRDCFSRTASFNWFVITVMGFIVRLDHHGVSSVVRWLNLDPDKYTSLLLFFRASSWKLKNIQQKWWQIVLTRSPAITIDGRHLIAGDGIKISKEAKKMPGVKRLHQESDNSSKAPYIYGHHFGALGILSGWVKKRSFASLFVLNSMKGRNSFESFRENLPHQLTEKGKLASPP